MRTFFFLVLGGAAGLALGCGGTVTSKTSGATSGGGGGTTGPGSTTGTGAGTTASGTGTTSSGSSPSGCPAAEPIGGQSCAGVTQGLVCSYGDSVRVDCRDVWTCSAGIWDMGKTDCPMPPTGTCGSSAPADGTTCSTQGDLCTYGDTLCLCSECPGGPCMAPPPKWTCSGPPTTAGCPPIAPNEGSACSMDGLMCTYGFPCGGSGANAVCSGGSWAWQGVGCPQ